MLDETLTTLLIISALLWGVLGMTGINLISRLSNSIGQPTLTRIIYTVFGLVAFLHLYRSIRVDDDLYFPVDLLNYGAVSSGDRHIDLAVGPDVDYVMYWGDHPGSSGISKVEGGKSKLDVNEDRVRYRCVRGNKLGKEKKIHV